VQLDISHRPERCASVCLIQPELRRATIMFAQMGKERLRIFHR
jgi:hypothetical protein